MNVQSTRMSLGTFAFMNNYISLHNAGIRQSDVSIESIKALLNERFDQIHPAVDGLYAPGNNNARFAGYRAVHGFPASMCPGFRTNQDAAVYGLQACHIRFPSNADFSVDCGR